MFEEEISIELWHSICGMKRKHKEFVRFILPGASTGSLRLQGVEGRPGLRLQQVRLHQADAVDVSCAAFNHVMTTKDVFFGN
jgi:hypothetical protein